MEDTTDAAGAGNALNSSPYIHPNMFLGQSLAFLAAAAALSASVGAFSPASPRCTPPKKAHHKKFGLTSSRLRTSRLFQRYDDAPAYGQSGERSDGRRRNFSDLGRKGGGGGGGGTDRSKDWFRYYEDRAEDRRPAPRYDPQDDERYRSRNRSDAYAYDTEDERPREDERYRYDDGRYTDRGRADDYLQSLGQQPGQRYDDESRFDDGRRGMDRQEQRDDYDSYRQEGRGQRYGQDGEDRYDQRSEYDRRYSDGYDSTDSRRERSYYNNRGFDGYADDRRRDFDYREPRGDLMRRTRDDDDRYNRGYYSNYDRRGGALARRRRYSDDPYLPILRFPSGPFFSPFAPLDAMMGRMLKPMTRRASRLQFQMNDMARDDAGDLIDEALDILDRDRTIRSMTRSGDPPIRLASSNRAIFSRSSSMTLVDGVQKELLKIGAKLNYPWTMWLVAENGRLKSLVLIDEIERGRPCQAEKVQR